MPRAVALAGLLLLVAATFGGSTPAAVGTSRPVPLIGANFTHYASRSCGLEHGIVTHYGL